MFYEIIFVSFPHYDNLYAEHHIYEFNPNLPRNSTIDVPVKLPPALMALLVFFPPVTVFFMYSLFFPHP